MAINPETQYPGKIAPGDANYPYGSARNVTTPGDGTGTPWEAALVNDLFGFQQALLNEDQRVPSGSPEKVGASQYLESLLSLLGSKVASTVAVFGRNLAKHQAFITLGYGAVGDGGGARFAATGTTVIGKAGTFDKPNGLIYDVVGTEFAYDEQIINVLAFGAKADLNSGDTDNGPVFEDCVNFAKKRATWGQRISFPAIGDGYLTSEVTVDSAKGLIFGGENATIKMTNVGTNDYIFNLTNCSECIFLRNRFVGTTDDDPLFDFANRRAGLGVFTSSFIAVEQNTFEKFNSFGIFAQNLVGGTYTEGMRIRNNVFRDFNYDSNTAFQCGILLSSDGEYSTITNNSFFRIPSAIRFDDGANSLFAHNIVMQLNGEYRLDAAAIYSQQNSNSGKLQIVNNKLNHIETGQLIMFLKNDPTKPQNACIVDANELLVNGSPTNSQQIVLKDYPNSRVTNNSIRPNNVVVGDECLRLNDCENAYVDGNYFKGGDYAITAEAENILVGTNIYDGQATGKFQSLSGAEVRVTKNRAYAFRITATGTQGSPWDDDDVTVSQIAAGHFQLAHNFGTVDYAVAVINDNDATAPERRYSVVRGTTTTDIYIKDGAGVSLSDEILVTITHGINSEYAL